MRDAEQVKIGMCIDTCTCVYLLLRVHTSVYSNMIDDLGGKLLLF